MIGCPGGAVAINGDFSQANGSLHVNQCAAISGGPEELF